ncbi:hypothetical protein GXP67_27440 [Rhodocytophaga rosea]|uniref:Lipoprotein n=1 Tax=Rhodocytophaga rosea TaxID=2704465 RepID=A0A6C0GQH8_9BACT|nr:hypothetical protein [Rhodocytophaga rosea]QHT70114.1 hypothetical protein GXP67_27440 [Rhodocytophaga rosea]
MNVSIRSKRVSILFVALISSLCSCVQLQRSEEIVSQQQLEEESNYINEVHVFVTQPTARAYQETMRYEAIGSNISSFEHVLKRVKKRARKDGCEALVQVKFYRQMFGNGKLGSSFPKVEAIGIRYTDDYYGQSSIKE